MIWRERNDRTFNDTPHNFSCCIFSTYLHIIHWTGKLGDREMVCISDDDNNYVHDNSVMAQEHREGDLDREE